MMVKKTIRRLLGVLPLLIGLLVLLGGTPPTRLSASSTQIALEAPSFVQVPRSAETIPNAISSVLDREAGIAAYYQAPSPVALSQVKGLFHTIEIDTFDYILGSVSVPSNWEEYDVHVYIHRSGWMLAYYLRDAPAAWLFDWQTCSGTMNPTRFQAVLNHIATTLAMPTPALTYYDFRYPNATNVLLAMEYVSAGWQQESFTILDTGFYYFEQSWGLGGNYGSYVNGRFDVAAYAEYKLDGEVIVRNTAKNTTRFDYGFLSPTQLPPNEPHAIAVYVGDSSLVRGKMGVLAIVYGPQP
jgi:hypothetical protein